MLRFIFKNTSPRILNMTVRKMSKAKNFEEAVKVLSSLSKEPDNDTKLKIYGLFKQASVGECTTSKPGMLDMVGKAKWSAWKQLGTMSQTEAKEAYTNLINDLFSKEPSSSSSSSTSSSSSSSSFSSGDGDLLKEVDGKVYKITFNRPDKKNAIKTAMYGEFTEALKEAAQSDVTVVAVTGAGNFYCSGNDLSNFTSIDLSNMRPEAEKAGKILEDFVASLIDFPKPIIGLVNGPCVGIAATNLALFDLVIASDKATFHTPFSSLGQSPESCSSVTFPKIFGPSLASELLYFNKKISAHQALDSGFVSEVIPDASFQKEAWNRVVEYSKLPPESLQICKLVVREAQRAELHAANKLECKHLIDRWCSQECMNAVLGFFKSKM